MDDDFWQNFPDEFEATTYRSLNPDLAHMSDADLLDHYENCGREEGRAANRLHDRNDFAALVAKSPAVLEIGPFCNPMLRGPNVSYFDVLSQEELIARARSFGFDPAGVPHIDYVSPTSDLSTIEHRFDAVISSHCVEHQTDLVGHLQAVERLLRPGGVYCLLVPDKRYCFDHFIAASNLAEAIVAHHERRQAHTLRSVIEHRALITHNDSVRHWQGDHGVVYDNLEERFQAALQEFGNAKGKYIDVHAWYFTPDSAFAIFSALQRMGLSRLGVHTIYPTRYCANEFWMILIAGGQSREAAEQPPPENTGLLRQLRQQLANQIAATAKQDEEARQLRSQFNELRSEFNELRSQLNARNESLRAVTIACADRTLWARPRRPRRSWLRRLRYSSLPLPRLREPVRRARALLGDADRARDSGEWMKAAEHYREALSLLPDAAPIWVQYGHALRGSGHLAEAEAAYRRSLELNASVADTHLQLAQTLTLQGRREEAVAACLRAIVLDPVLSHGAQELMVR